MIIAAISALKCFLRFTTCRPVKFGYRRIGNTMSRGATDE
jgi:hypothetical protein